MFRKTTLILLPLLILLALLGGTLAATGSPLATVTPTPTPVDQENILIEAPARPTPLPPPETEEKLPYGTGYILPPMDLSHLTGQRISPAGTSIQALPPSFDWRDTGKVTPVKDQNPCGTCYTFAALGNIESKMLIDGAGTYDFSENNAKECNWRELNDPGRDSCAAGGTYYMMASLFSQKGTVLEADDPYVTSDALCNFSATYQKTLLDWHIISDPVPDTNVLKQAIYDHGPVFAAMYASFPGFDMSYDGSYTFYYTGTETPNHAVLIVGWDDSLPHAGGTGGWIVKNSYGTGWGDNGYFTIAYGSASIGSGSSFMYDWQDYDPYGDLWFYDEDGMNNAYGCSGTTTTAWLLAKFIPDSDTYATRVEFWTSDITTDVDVYLYDNFDGSSLSNLLAQKLNNSFTKAGYHSVALDSPVAVSNGDDVMAVVKVTNDSLNAPIVVDVNGPNETGRTYYSCNGSVWTDMGVALNVDIAVRLRTSSAAAPAPPASGSTTWIQSNDSGFGDTTNTSALSLAPFNGNLYASTYNEGGNGFQLWWLNNGEWSPEWQGEPAMSDSVAIVDMIVVGDTLYAGTINRVAGGSVLVFDGTDWGQANDPGFGDPTNTEVLRFAVFSDTLYAGTTNETSGGEVWRCQTCDGSDWSQVVGAGFGDANNEAIPSFAVLNNTLYAGTYNSATGGEVWRSSNGTAWSQVNADGFGSANNRSASALAVFNNSLYASTRGNTGFGSQVWRCQTCDGSDWSRVVDNGFGNANTNDFSTLQMFDSHLYLAVGNTTTGLEVWRTADGTNWAQVGFAGFGNSNNVWPSCSMGVYNGSLYVGTANWTDGGGEVWLYLHETVFLPVVLSNKN